MDSDGSRDGAAAVRHARFGRLPERIRFEDMVQELPAGAKSPAGDGYSPEKSWISYSCLALDLGL